jgi:hypothetical protein
LVAVIELVSAGFLHVSRKFQRELQNVISATDRRGIYADNKNELKSVFICENPWLKNQLKKVLSRSPIIGLVGARQVGKTHPRSQSRCVM